MQEQYSIKDGRVFKETVHTINLLDTINANNNSHKVLTKLARHQILKRLGFYVGLVFALMIIGVVNILYSNSFSLSLVVSLGIFFLAVVAWGFAYIDDIFKEGLKVSTADFIEQNREYLKAYGRNFVEHRYNHISEVYFGVVIIHSNEKEAKRGRGDIAIEVHYRAEGSSSIMDIYLKFSEDLKTLTVDSFTITKQEEADYP